MPMQHISTGLAGLRDEADREDGEPCEEPYLAGAVGSRAEGARGERAEGRLAEVALWRRGDGELLAERMAGRGEQAAVRAQARARPHGQERGDPHRGDMLQAPLAG